MNFNQQLACLDKGKTLDFLKGRKSPCYESLLIKEAYADYDPFGSALDLLQKHFVLFHFLYTQQNEFASNGMLLHIHFMRMHLLPFPPKGKCRHYEESRGIFCPKEAPGGSYCSFHQRKEEETALTDLSLKYFYLDKDNYFNMDAETAEAFISGAWEIVLNQEEIKKAQMELGLPTGFDLLMLKRKFKNLARTHHPDRAGGNQEDFKRINKAYQLLLKMFP